MRFKRRHALEAAGCLSGAGRKADHSKCRGPLHRNSVAFARVWAGHSIIKRAEKDEMILSFDMRDVRACRARMHVFCLRRLKDRRGFKVLQLRINAFQLDLPLLLPFSQVLRKGCDHLDFFEVFHLRQYLSDMLDHASPLREVQQADAEGTLNV